MPRLTKAVPKYQKHRASGQAVVRLNGQDFELGPHAFGQPSDIRQTPEMQSCGTIGNSCQREYWPLHNSGLFLCPSILHQEKIGCQVPGVLKAV